MAGRPPARPCAKSQGWWLCAWCPVSARRCCRGWGVCLTCASCSVPPHPSPPVQELGLPVLDLWTDFQAQQGWQQGLLEDGLHLTPDGNQRVGRLLLELIAREFPQLR